MRNTKGTPLPYVTIAQSATGEWEIIAESNQRTPCVKAAQRHSATARQHGRLPSIVIYRTGSRSFVSAIYPYTVTSTDIEAVRSLDGFSNLTI